MIVTQAKYRSRQAGSFWEEAAKQLLVPVTGKAVEQLLKNLKIEYQKVKRELHMFGAGTDGHPRLHRSSRVFDEYEQFYMIYYAHGGSPVPSMVMTESSSAVLLARYWIIVKLNLV